MVDSDVEMKRHARKIHREVDVRMENFARFKLIVLKVNSLLQTPIKGNRVKMNGGCHGSEVCN